MSNLPSQVYNKKIGLIVGSFKPYTKGHHFLITKASNENDLVYLFISQHDRKRKGEHHIAFSIMKNIWLTYIVYIMPRNIVLSFTDSPINDLYNFLIENEEMKNNQSNIFTLYTDSKDKNRYCYNDHQISKKFPSLYQNKLIKTDTTSRENNINVSATLSRRFLKEKNFELFSQTLPNELINKSKEIYELLV